MKYELIQQLAKIKAMRGQCIEARKKIAAAGNELHRETQDDIEVYSRLAQRGEPGADVAYAGLLKNRGMISAMPGVSK